jgi:hypothetical protein
VLLELNRRQAQTQVTSALLTLHQQVQNGKLELPESVHWSLCLDNSEREGVSTVNLKGCKALKRGWEPGALRPVCHFFVCQVFRTRKRMALERM